MCYYYLRVRTGCLWHIVECLTDTKQFKKVYTMCAKKSKRILIGIVIILIAFGIWYYFIDTLTISQIVGDDVSQNVDMLVNAFDFDTEISRYNFNKLKFKVAKWDKGLQEINRINDPTNRDTEREKVIEEIVSDPTVKKLMKHIPDFGKDAVMTLFDIIN